jgi:hypothetical protein
MRGYTIVCRMKHANTILDKSYQNQDRCTFRSHREYCNIACSSQCWRTPASKGCHVCAIGVAALSTRRGRRAGAAPGTSSTTFPQPRPDGQFCIHFFFPEILYLYRTYSDHKHSWKHFSVGKWLRCGCGLNSVGMRRANGTVVTILKWRRSTSRSQSVPVSAAVLSPKLYSHARHGWSEGRLRRAWG